MKVITVSILATLFGFLLFSNAQCGQAPGEVVEIADRVATWQLSNLHSNEGIRTFQERTAEKNGWIRAAFYVGLNRWQTVSPKPEFEKALFDMATENEWGLGDRYWHADDQAIAQVYLELEGADAGPTREAFDSVLALTTLCSGPTRPLQMM